MTEPKLIRTGQLVNIDGRLFRSFVDCTIEQIEPEILVSDYLPIRRKPENLRKNTEEVMDVTNFVDPNGQNRVAVELLNQYTRIQLKETTEKTIESIYSSDQLLYIIFTDNTYYSEENEWSELDNCYYKNHPRLTTRVLESLNLIQKDTLKRLKETDRQISNINNKIVLNKQLTEAKHLLARHGQL
jgi:hypothetical protein